MVFPNNNSSPPGIVPPSTQSGEEHPTEGLTTVSPTVPHIPFTTILIKASKHYLFTCMCAITHCNASYIVTYIMG